MHELGGERARHRRLYVVSDGEWGDKANTDLAKAMKKSPGVHFAALFVSSDAPPEARALFPTHSAAAENLADALLRLESEAPDRTVEQAVATEGRVPAWMRGGVPQRRKFFDFPRLYPRGAGETVVLAAGEVPVLGAREEGGRVAQAASADAAGPGLLRACLRSDGGVALRADREGRALVLSARGSGGAPFVIGAAEIAARAAGPDLWEARVESASPDAFLVTCAGAMRRVAPAAAFELAGLRPDAEYAAAIARRSGGRFFADAAPSGGAASAEAAPARAAASVTLLAAALFVLLAALLRRGR
ncbi:MAG: hypothetical protein ACYTGZ_22930, partial [Planctomycetota bacterium]|jgi:hypothetical protein